jgi:hypothetical protein
LFPPPTTPIDRDIDAAYRISSTSSAASGALKHEGLASGPVRLACRRLQRVRKRFLSAPGLIDASYATLLTLPGWRNWTYAADLKKTEPAMASRHKARIRTGDPPQLRPVAVPSELFGSRRIVSGHHVAVGTFLGPLEVVRLRD